MAHRPCLSLRISQRDIRRSLAALGIQAPDDDREAVARFREMMSESRAAAGRVSDGDLISGLVVEVARIAGVRA